MNQKTAPGLFRRPLRARRTLAGAALAAALAAFSPGVAGAQTYPTRDVTLVVGYAAGGTGDVVARIISEHLAKRLGKAVIVDNKP
ncbi:MAG: hypothetical protein B7Y84_01430, partial [Azorhizobium sp. 32-67-21]